MLEHRRTEIKLPGGDGKPGLLCYTSEDLRAGAAKGSLARAPGLDSDQHKEPTHRCRARAAGHDPGPARKEELHGLTRTALVWSKPRSALFLQTQSSLPVPKPHPLQCSLKAAPEDPHQAKARVRRPLPHIPSHPPLSEEAETFTKVYRASAQLLDRPTTSKHGAFASALSLIILDSHKVHSAPHFTALSRKAWQQGLSR